MEITPQEFYSILRANNIDEARANQILEEQIEDNGGTVNGKLTVDEFTLSENENFQDIKNSGDSGPRDLRNLTDIFDGDDDSDSADSTTKDQEEMDAAILKLVEGLIGNGQGIQGDDSGVSGIDPRLIDQLNSLDSGVGDLGSPYLGDFIRRLKQTKLDQIENRDWINYLAANNASIHDTIKLAASAR